MSIKRNLETKYFMLQVHGTPVRNELNEIIDVWEDILNIPVQIQEINKVRYSNNVRYTETSLIGIVRGFEIRQGNYRLKGEDGFYEVIKAKKIGTRFVMELKKIEGV